MKQYATLEATVYFWFAANDTSGSGGDGASPAADVRLAGAAAGAAPVLSPTPVLLSHANYPAGCYEVAVAATAANGFAANNTYAVFCTLAIDSQNPTGFIGSFDLKPVEANTKQIEGSDATDTIDARIDARLAAYDPPTKAEMDTGHAALDTLIDAIKAKTDNLPSGIPKNVALSNFEFVMIDSADHITPKTGLTVTCQISLDGGAYGASTNSPTEVGSGTYKIDFTQAERNAIVATYKFAATGADTRLITIVSPV